VIQSFDHHLSSQNHDLGKAEKLILPDVPEEQSVDENISVPTVEEIEDNWIKLRFFKKIWLPAKDSSDPHLNSQSPVIKTKLPLFDETPLTPKTSDESDPLEDRNTFNECYCDPSTCDHKSPF
jgi:hypothetical protein